MLEEKGYFAKKYNELTTEKENKEQELEEKSKELEENKQELESALKRIAEL